MGTCTRPAPVVGRTGSRLRRMTPPEGGSVRPVVYVPLFRIVEPLSTRARRDLAQRDRPVESLRSCGPGPGDHRWSEQLEQDHQPKQMPDRWTD